MALIKCFECGNEISDTAAICPKCGISLEKENNIVFENVEKKDSSNKVLKVLSIIFISIYSVFSLYSVFTNIQSFFEYIDIAEPVDFCYYLSDSIYCIGTTALLWMLFIYGNTKNKIFNILSGGILIIMVLFTLIYYAAGLFAWVESIDDFPDLLGSMVENFFGYYGMAIAMYLLYINKK